MNDKTTVRSIRVASFAVLGIAVLALLGGLLIPFNVEELASGQALTGSIEIVPPAGPPLTIQPDSAFELAVGQSLRTQADGEAYLIFELNQGRAMLESETQLTLVESFRRATSLGHARSTDQSYTLTLKQTRGRVRYLFASTTPPITEIDFVIQLPDGNYTPDTPCWIITIDPTGSSTIDPLTCPT